MRLVWLPCFLAVIVPTFALPDLLPGDPTVDTVTVEQALSYRIDFLVRTEHASAAFCKAFTDGKKSTPSVPEMLLPDFWNDTSSMWNPDCGRRCLVSMPGLDSNTHYQVWCLAAAVGGFSGLRCGGGCSVKIKTKIKKCIFEN